MIDDLSFGTPAILGAGVEKFIQVDLTAKEKAALDKSTSVARANGQRLVAALEHRSALAGAQSERETDGSDGTELSGRSFERRGRFYRRTTLRARRKHDPL
jgi:hypothetical protein